MFKLSNVKDWKSSVKGIVTAVLIGLGLFISKIDADFQFAFLQQLDVLLVAGGALFALVSDLFRKDAPVEGEVVVSEEDAEKLKEKAA